jgi:very-short-patch-repair endonuclease
MSHRSDAAAIVKRQDGLITHRQAIQSGVTADALRGLRARGEWMTVLPQVYRVVESHQTAESTIRAASLWAGQPACVSGIAAASWWGLIAKAPSRVEITIPRTRRLRSRPEAVIKRRFLPPEDRALLRDVAVTGLPLTSLHAAVALGSAGPEMLDRALQTRVRFAEVRAAHYRNLGCHGSHDAGLLLIAAADRAAAQSERTFIRLMKRSGIGGWRANQAVHVGSLTRTCDFVFLRERVIVEIDGWAWHHTPDRFNADRFKQNALTNGGWRVLRFTWLDLTQRPGYVVREVRSALDRAA